MDHIAILRKARISKGDNLLGSMLDGSKTIESRWYVNKIDPWNKIKAGDKVYLKESGCPVTAVCDVTKVLHFENLDPSTIKNIITEYGKGIAPTTTQNELTAWAKTLSNKRYCILIFVKNAIRINPIEIDKKGYGISSAWMCVGNIKNVTAKY